MGEAAIRAAKAVNYTNAGTIEFLMDPKGNFYFMEMNTRIQVEHPVTELVTGVDLVYEQILVAAGEKLRYHQSEIQMRGHAIECRINAEDPEKFLPSPGQIVAYHAPGGIGVRVDSAVYADYVVPRYYDSLIAKLVVWGETRAHAIQRMRRALREYMVDGIKTNIPFHQKVMDNRDYRAGKVDTSFITKM
jgi:acetyl-CoA carboxylase biotin carboxylase subunit